MAQISLGTTGNGAYNGLYHVLSVDLSTAHNGENNYRFFLDPNTGQQTCYIGYISVLQADSACSIVLGNSETSTNYTVQPTGDQIPMKVGSYFNIHYHMGISDIWVYNSAGSAGNKLILLVTG